MMKKYLYFIILLSSFTLFGQEYFNATKPLSYENIGGVKTPNAENQFNYKYSSSYPYMQNVFTMADTGYVLVGGGIRYSKFSIEANYFDASGNFIWNKHYGEGIYDYYHSLQNGCIKTNGGYIFAGSRTTGSYATGLKMLYLVKFNNAFDTLWTRTFFTDSAFVCSRGICNTPDGGFLILGETELNNDSIHSSDQTKGLMLKVDSLGNYQWFKSYGTENNHDSFTKAICTPDGGYLIAGHTMSWQDNLPYIDKGDWWLVKTDSLGNMEWDNRYGSLQYKETFVGKILKSSDTCYYIVGGHTYYPIPYYPNYRF